MRAICVLAALIAVAAGVTPAASQSVLDANWTMPGCRANLSPGSNEFMKMGYCVGIISGIIYAAPDVCAPKGSNNEQSVRVVVAYIDRIPARMHEDFAKLAHEALRTAWPCKR